MKRKLTFRWLTPSNLTLLICLIYVLGVLINSTGSPLAFARLGTRFTEGDPRGTEGYDGQFAYQIALNPTGAAPYLDVPAYRYQRILYPMLARLLAFGQAAFIPWTLILVNLLAIGIGTWLTEQILVKLRVSRWYALVYGLYGAQLVALRTDLNEPLAQALVQAAILAWLLQRRWLAVLAFALAALGKETTLIFWAGFFLYTLARQNWRWSLNLSLALVPFLIYQGRLWYWLGNFGVGSGGAGATSFSLLPLGGWLAMAQVSVVAFLLVSLVVVPMSILPALAGLYRAGRNLLERKFHPFIFCLFLNSLVIIFLPNSTFREPVAMLRLTQGLVVSMLLFGGLTRSWRVLNYSTLWIFTNALLIK